MLNIYVPLSSNTQTTLLSSSSYLSGSYCYWTNDASNNRYYNTVCNIFVYPVENVASVYESSEDSTIGLMIKNPKFEYYPGEEFDPTGMDVYLHREDDTIEIVSDYTYSVDNDVCTVSYINDGNEYTTSF